MRLEIDQQRKHATTCLILSGQLDASTATVLAERLCALRTSDAAVQLDLSRVELIDGFGAGVLRAAVGDAIRYRRQLHIAPYLRRPVRRVLDQAGLSLPHRDPASRIADCDLG